MVTQVDLVNSPIRLQPLNDSNESMKTEPIPREVNFLEILELQEHVCEF